MKQYLLPFLFIAIFSCYGQDETRLFYAIETNNLEKVKSLVNEGANVNALNERYFTACRQAALKGNLEIVQFLVESGAKEDYLIVSAVEGNNIQVVKYLIEKDFFIGNAVLYAAENNNLQMVQLLVENGANVNVEEKRKKGLFLKKKVSPVDAAVSHNNLAMVNLLIENGVKLKTGIESALDYGRNEMIFELSNRLVDKEWLLAEAFTRENDPVVNRLINQGVSPKCEDRLGNSLLLIAATMGDLEGVKKCLEEYKLDLYKKNSRGENALMRAAISESLEVCEYLLEKGIPIDSENNQGQTALFYTINDRSHLVFELFLEKGANLNHVSTEGNTVLIEAAINLKRNLMLFLLSKGANVEVANKENKTAFYYVVSNSHGFQSEEELENAFIQAGADVNTTGNKGETLLFKVIENGTLDRISSLISRGADVNTLNDNDERPSCKKPETIKYLLENGADLNATDDWDNTYLCDAVKQDDLDFASFLIDLGANVNVPCNGFENETALVEAIKKRNFSMVELLSENGADLNTLSFQGKTPIDYAKDQGMPELVHFLRSRGALTLEDRNLLYREAKKLESEIKSALIAEDLNSIILLMSEQDEIALSKDLIQDLAYVAAKKGHQPMINKLLSDIPSFHLDYSINSSNQTILFIATMYAQNELIIDLLAKGANQNHLDKNGNKAIHFAAKNSTKKILKKWARNQ